MSDTTDSVALVGKLLAKHKGLAKAAATVALVEGGIVLYDRAKSTWRKRFAYTVTVSEADGFYADVHEWLLTFMPAGQQRALVATTTRPGGDVDDDPVTPSGGRRKASLRLLSNDRQARTVTIDGHRVSVEVERSEATSEGRQRPPSNIVFTCHTDAGRKAVLKHLDEIVNQRQKSVPVLRMANEWGNWNRRSDLPLRELNSVIIPTQQRDRIVDDMRRFLEAEDDYVRRGIPWHRGYMFHGPPGGGKSSLVKALANEFGLDLWYISLADLGKEAGLMSMLSDVRSRSIVLLEDIDTVRVTQERKGKKGEISMSGLLNALDGVTTPHGLITIMTTNHFEVLDPALTRPGRMDLVEEIGHPRGAEIRALYQFFFGQPLSNTPLEYYREYGISQAEVAEIFKRNMDDAAAAERELQARIALSGTIVEAA